MVAEAAHAHVDLAQSVEEQQAGHHRRVLELPLHELERRQGAHLEQPPARRRAFEQLPALVRRQRRRAMLRAEDLAATMGTNSSCQRRSVVGVAAAELRDRRDGAFDVRPPFERAAVAGEQRDVELRLDVARAVAFEIEIRVPRHGGDRPLEERVGVVQKAGLARVFERGETAAGDRSTIDGQHPEPGLAKVARQDQRVVPGAKDDAVVVARRDSGTRGSGLGLVSGTGTDPQSRDRPESPVPSPGSRLIPSETLSPTAPCRPTNMTRAPQTSPVCGDQRSPCQMPRSSDTA